MSRGKVRRAPVTPMDRALNEIYKMIPNMPACTGACSDACGPIAMTAGEWERIIRYKGHVPQLRDKMTCPMLSPTGKCTVYTVRPYICRLWGTVKEMRCPQGCEPERWLTRAEAQVIFDGIMEVAGPGTAGPLGTVPDLWQAIALPQRAARQAVIDRKRKAASGE